MRLLSFADYQRAFGGLDPRSEVGYAVQQFFLNGGTEAWVVRVASPKDGAPPAAASVVLQDPAGADLLLVTAIDEGEWGNGLRVSVDHDTPDARTFNLVVSEVDVVDNRTVAVATETYRNVTVAPDTANDVVSVVNDGSRLVRLKYVGSTSGSPRPAPNGTVGAVLDKDKAGAVDKTHKLAVALASGALKAEGLALDALPTETNPVLRVSAIAAQLQGILRKAGFAGATLVAVAARDAAGQPAVRIIARPGTASPGDALVFTGELATDLGLAGPGASTNVQAYAPFAPPAPAAPPAGAKPVGFQGAATPGTDGAPPDAAALQGSPAEKRGLYALEGVDLFNILSIPDTARLLDTDAAAVAAEATAYVGRRRAIYLLDMPKAKDRASAVTPTEVMAWLAAHDTLRDKNVALYYPRPKIADPCNGFRLREVPSSGTVAGVLARTDTERGVWKAPAGTEAAMRGVQALEYAATDGENGLLNPLAINCLRTLPTYGNVVWGARTLDGSDQKGSEWKYLPVRRTALYIEESLYRGMKWAVFEPNDEPLWAQIRLNAGSFMHRLFQQGAFQGQSPKDAYFVRCDRSTTTQDDVNRGIVNVLVGFAPLKPAEFVVLKLSQIAGQIEA